MNKSINVGRVVTPPFVDQGLCGVGWGREELKDTLGPLHPYTTCEYCMYIIGRCAQDIKLRIIKEEKWYFHVENELHNRMWGENNLLQPNLSENKGVFLGFNGNKVCILLEFMKE